MKDIHLTTVYYMRLDRAQFIFFFKFDSKDSTLAQPYSTIRSMLRRQRETRRRANAGNVRLYYPYWQYTIDLYAQLCHKRTQFISSYACT